MNAVAPNAPNRCWKVAEWPQQDQAAWAAAGLPGDPLCPGGLAARWAEATRRMVENGYGRWIGFLDRSDLLDLTETTAQRATKERVMVYREDLATSTAPFSVLTRLRQLGKALSAMCPEHDWSWIYAGRIACGPTRPRCAPSGSGFSPPAGLPPSASSSWTRPISRSLPRPKSAPLSSGMGF